MLIIFTQYIWGRVFNIEYQIKPKFTKIKISIQRRYLKH